MALIILLVARVVLEFVGFDRAPAISNNDEVLMNDQALALARHQGLKAVSYDGLSISELYAHHPPLWSYSAAAIYRALGFSRFTLRLPSDIYYSISLCMIGCIILRLYKTGRIDGSFASMGLLLMCSDFVGLSYSRFGRADPLAMFFGSAGLLVALYDSDDFRPWAQLAGAMSIGLSLSIYIGAVFWAIAWGVAVVVNNKREQKKRLLLLSIPIVVFALIWWVGYGRRSLLALHEMRDIGNYMVTPGSGAKWLLDSLERHDWRSAMQSGGGTLLGSFGISVMTAIGCGIYIQRSKRRFIHSRLWALGAMTGVWAATYLLTGAGRGKIIEYWPILVLGFGVSWCGISGRLRSLALIAASSICILNSITIIAYFRVLHREWYDRSPERLRSIADSIPVGAKVCGPPQLWFQFMLEGRRFRVVDYGFGPDRAYWTNDPRRFANYDYVILPADHPACRYGVFANYRRRWVDSFDSAMVVYSRDTHLPLER